jgi:hypothetical protein
MILFHELYGKSPGIIPAEYKTAGTLVPAVPVLWINGKL